MNEGVFKLLSSWNQWVMMVRPRECVQNNWDAFEDLIGNLAWAAGIFDVIERSRNVIMHSGMLEKEDIERLGVNIRDWIKQVGA